MTEGQPSPNSPAELSSVLIVGTGLMGTSAALALRVAGVKVSLHDTDPLAAALAQDLGAGSTALPDDDPDLVVIAVPPGMIGKEVADWQRTYGSSSVTDLASVKTQPQLDVEHLADPARFVGGHPLAGRERSGGRAARSDLFEGRPWVLTPSAHTDTVTIQRATALAEICGAVPVTMTSEAHDRAVALVSHLPQVAASLVAARLADADNDAVALAGPALRDVTRVAASDAALWQEILTSNATFLLGVLDDLAVDLARTRDALGFAIAVAAAQDSDGTPTSRGPAGASGSVDAVMDMLLRGNAGRARLPGKHGSAPTTYATVAVVVPDRPGELARLLVACGVAEVNVEDVSIEHSEGQPVGLVELFVKPAAANGLVVALRDGGWVVHE